MEVRVLYTSPGEVSIASWLAIASSTQIVSRSVQDTFVRFLKYRHDSLSSCEVWLNLRIAQQIIPRCGLPNEIQFYSLYILCWFYKRPEQVLSSSNVSSTPPFNHLVNELFYSHPSRATLLFTSSNITSRCRQEMLIYNEDWIPSRAIMQRRQISAHQFIAIRSPIVHIMTIHQSL